MSHDHSDLIAQFRETLTQQRYSPVVVHNCCRNADHFLRYLAEREIAVEAATPAEVSNYLRAAVRWFRKRHGYSPAPPWHSVPRAAIHALLRRVQKRWPPEPMASDPGEILCRAVCSEYQEWLSVQRGLAVASVDDLMWEAQQFLYWYKERAGVFSFDPGGTNAYAWSLQVLHNRRENLLLPRIGLRNTLRIGRAGKVCQEEGEKWKSCQHADTSSGRSVALRRNLSRVTWRQSYVETAGRVKSMTLG